MLSGRNQSKRPNTVGSVFICNVQQANPEREKADWWLLRAWEEGERKMGANGVILRGDEVEGEQQYTRCHEIIHFKMDIIMLYGSHINRLLPPKPHSSSDSSASS